MARPIKGMYDPDEEVVRAVGHYFDPNDQRFNNSRNDTKLFHEFHKIDARTANALGRYGICSVDAMNDVDNYNLLSDIRNWGTASGVFAYDFFAERGCYGRWMRTVAEWNLTTGPTAACNKSGCTRSTRLYCTACFKALCSLHYFYSDGSGLHVNNKELRCNRKHRVQ